MKKTTFFGYLLILMFTAKATAQSFELVQDFGTQTELQNATGVSVADYDLDGDLDVFIVASEIFDANNPMTWSRLLRNDGESGFLNVTLESNLINWDAETREGTMGAKMGASWADYDNDGYPDLFIANYGYDELWHNEGDGTFKNVSVEAGIEGCFICYSATGTWWDYDNDGDLDLYVSDWLKENRLYRNDGGNIFTDISESSGLDDNGHTFSSLPMDLNNDGRMDLYTVNDISGNKFFKNKGLNHFQDLTAQAGLEFSGNGMGVDVCDFNNDGFFEIYLTSIYQYVPNPFFVNNGNGRFIDQAVKYGIDDTGWGWGARFFDADHDLDEDLYVVNGFDSPAAEGDRNKFFKNESGIYSEISAALGVDNEAIALGLEVFDYDSDGDLDMLVGNRDALVSLYKNKTVETENLNWIQIQLDGTESNRNGFGSIVKITCEGQNYYRYHSGVNVFGQSVKPVHFGLKAFNQVDKIEVKWPSGRTEFFGEFSANQIINLIEGTGTEIIIEPIENSLNIFPNPFQNELWLSTGQEKSIEVEFNLTDMMGRTIESKKMTLPEGRNNLIPLLESVEIGQGLYFYSIKGGEVEYEGKLIKH